MKVEGKKILEKLERQKSDRQKVTLYLSKTKYDVFRKACGDVAPSQVIEELMVQFTQSVKGKRRS
jgi:hypothetical protein